MEIYLIRHGEINRDGSKEDYFYRLTDIGNDNARNMAQFIHDNYFDKNKKNSLVSSKTIRTIETSLYLSHALDLKLELIDDSHELDMGFNECKPKRDWLYVDQNNRFIDRTGLPDEERFKIRHYKGESPLIVYERMATLENYILHSPSDVLYIVGHGTSLRLLTMRLMGYKPNWFYEEPVPSNCSVKKLTLTNNQVIDEGYMRR
jgi:broad specificity phosphatase PhoE